MFFAFTRKAVAPRQTKNSARASVLLKLSFRNITDRMLLKMIPMEVVEANNIWFP